MCFNVYVKAIFLPILPQEYVTISFRGQKFLENNIIFPSVSDICSVHKNVTGGMSRKANNTAFIPKIAAVCKVLL